MVCLIHLISEGSDQIVIRVHADEISILRRQLDSGARPRHLEGVKNPFWIRSQPSAPSPFRKRLSDSIHM